MGDLHDVSGRWELSSFCLPPELYIGLGKSLARWEGVWDGCRCVGRRLLRKALAARRGQRRTRGIAWEEMPLAAVAAPRPHQVPTLRGIEA